MASDSAPIELGRIVGTHGVRGWVKVYSDCRPREAIFKYKDFLGLSSQGNRPLRLSASRVQGNGLVAKFVGVDDMDQARALNGLVLAVATLKPLQKGEFYWRDLIGLTVINRQEETLGRVKTLLETGANDVLVVVDDSDREILIPYVVPRYVEHIDLEQKQMRVDYSLDWLNEN